MPGRAQAGELGPGGHRQLGRYQHEEAGRPGRLGQVEPADPAQLDHGDACRVPQRGSAAFGMAAGGAQPLGHQRQSHDHIAGHDRAEVKVLERCGDPGREDQHARHLQQRQQPVGHVVGVVSGGEPGEVHPRPPQAEENRRVPRQRVARVPLCQRVSQLDARPRYRNHERQVKQQLQRRGGTVCLAGIAARHPPHPRPRACRELAHPAPPARADVNAIATFYQPGSGFRAATSPRVGGQGRRG